MSPIGIALIVGFIIILVFCIMIDKKGNEKFRIMIEETYPLVESFGSFYVTNNGEVLHELVSGTVLGYKKWNISDIAYIAAHRGQFSFLDKDKKAMRGEYLTPSKKKFLKEKAYTSFNLEMSQVNDFVAFMKKYGAHIQHMESGKVVEDK